jgi:hypothetical protein
MSQNEVAARSGSSPFHENWPWVCNMRLFGLKIGWDMARVFLTEAALTVSPPDFLSVGGNTNHDVGSPFCHFGYFLGL